MKKKLFLVLFIACIGINSTKAQNNWVSFTKETPEEPTVTLQQSNTSAVIFNLQTPGMYSEDITVDENLYQRLQLPGQRRTRAEGEPEMPFIRQLIAIPECEDISITVQTNSPVFFENYMVYPAPAYELVENPDGTFYLQEVFTKNDSIYNLDIFMPQVTAEITDIGYMRSQRIAEIVIFPIQFNPVTGELQVFTDIDITLDFTDAISDVSVNTGIFSNLVDNVLLNYTEGGIGASINDRSDEAGTVSWVEVTDTSGEITADYLIISASTFWDSENDDLFDLAQHRANYNGFDVAIVNVAHVTSDEVGYPYDPDYEDHIDEHRIRNFLKSVFENGTGHNTYDGKLAYVLLAGGEHINIPENYTVHTWKEYHSHHSEYAPADYHYSCLTYSNGTYDNYGDLFLGRLSVDSETQLENIVSKTIDFETEYQFGSWKQNVMLNAGDEGVNSVIDEIDSIIPENFNTLNYKMSEMGFDLISQALVDGFNDGQLLTQYRGHGGTTSWSTFRTEQFNLLNNYDKQGFVLSQACYTGNLDSPYIDYCMGEYFTTSNKGSVMFLGASRVTFRPYNNIFALSMHEAIWQNLSHISGEFTLEGQIKTYDAYSIPPLCQFLYTFR